MNIICPQCHSTNLPSAKFCSTCGSKFPDNQFKNKNILIIAAVAIGSVLLSCFMCGLLGGIQEEVVKPATNIEIQATPTPEIRTLTDQSTPEATPEITPTPESIEIEPENDIATESEIKETETAEPKSLPAKRKPSKSSGKIPSSGATAKCRDGSLSYSRSRRGTCSRHGGVAVWY